MHYLKTYPLTWSCIALIWLLCFCHPPAIDLGYNPLGWDKVAHVLMYAGTCGLLWIEYRRSHATISPLRLSVGAVALPIAMSALIEVLQGALTDFRGADPWDVVANAAGTLLAAAFGLFVYPRFIRKKGTASPS
ncbi:MAG: hypothetical protein ACI353_03880 [Alloprevotella sp.]